MLYLQKLGGLKFSLEITYDNILRLHIDTLQLIDDFINLSYLILALNGVLLHFKVS